MLLQNLNNLAGVIRGNLPSVTRKILIALITIDVHGRDTVTNMAKNKVTSRSETSSRSTVRYC